MKIKILFLSLFIGLCCYAQKVDLDREYVKTNYIKLPTDPINNIDQRTFSFISNDVRTENDILLYGYERINENGAINASLIYEPIVITEINIKEHVREKKDKEGNVTSVIKTYQPIIDYKTSAQFQYLNNVTGAKRNWNLGRREQYEGDKFNTYKKANQHTKLNRRVIKENLQNIFAENSSQYVNTLLNNKFGYTPATINELFWILDSDSNPEYNNHKKALTDIKNVFAKINNNTNVRSLESEVQPIVDYFNSVIPKFQSDKKRHRKMRYASYYNSAKLFYQIDMPDKAIEYAKKLIENDYDKGDGERIIKKSNQLKTAFINNEVSTRHFNVETIDNRTFETPVEPEIIVIEQEVVKEEKPVTELQLTGNTEIDNTIIENLLNEIELIIAVDAKKLFPFKGKFLKKNNKVYAKVFHPLYTYKNKYDTISIYRFKNKILGANYRGHDIDFVFDDSNMMKKIRAQNYSDLDYTLWRNNDAKIIKTENYYNNKIRTTNTLTYVNNSLKTILIDRKRSRDDKVLLTLIENSKNKHISTKKELYSKIEADTEYYNLTLESPSKLIFDQKTQYKTKSRRKPASYNKTYLFSDFGKVLKIEEKSTYYTAKKAEEVKIETTTVNTYQNQQLVRFILTKNIISNPKNSFKTILNYIDFKRRSMNNPEYVWKKGKYSFNHNDELISISRDGKHKTKENGVWSPWKYNSY